MSAKILLTGGAGFIGSHTFLALVNAGYDVAILDNFENASPEVPNRLALLVGRQPQVIHCDLNDAQGLRSALASDCFDAVVHFAAKKSVPESQTDPTGYYSSNVTGLINLANAMLSVGVNCLVFSSSAAVYGAAKNSPIPEVNPLSPLNPYADTKRVGEDFLRYLGRAHPEMKTGILRYFNPVGAHASGLIGEAPTQPPGNLMPVLARVASGEIHELQIFGGDYPTKDGTAVRDYIHVTDLAEGHALSLEVLLNGQSSHLVNLGTGRGYTVLEVVRAYGQAVGRELPYRIVDRRDGDAAESFANTSQARRILGFETKSNLAQMCQSGWDFYRRQIEGVAR